MKCYYQKLYIRHIEKFGLFLCLVIMLSACSLANLMKIRDEQKREFYKVTQLNMKGSNTLLLQQSEEPGHLLFFLGEDINHKVPTIRKMLVVNNSLEVLSGSPDSLVCRGVGDLTVLRGTLLHIKKNTLVICDTLGVTKPNGIVEVVLFDSDVEFLIVLNDANMHQCTAWRYSSYFETNRYSLADVPYKINFD